MSDEQAVDSPRDLLSMINEIDAKTIASGTTHAGNLWIAEKRGMWQKGKIVLQFYPELEDQVRNPKRGGRPKKDDDEREVSFRMVADETGRSATSVKKWVGLVVAIGKDEKKFRVWAREARLAQEEKWQRRLITADNTRKEPKPDRKKRIENATYNAVRQRMLRDEIEEGDAEYLFSETQKLRTGLSKVLVCLLDEEWDKAISVCEKLLSDTTVTEGEEVA